MMPEWLDCARAARADLQIILLAVQEERPLLNQQTPKTVAWSNSDYALITEK
jgi:hypothetical protein